jgi:ribosomal protein S6--L-glutamate ligase
MKVGVAGIPNAWSSERMAHALREDGADAFVFSLGDCLHDLSAGRVTLQGFDLTTLDAIVVKKLASQSDPAARLRLHMLRELESRGVRVFSPPSVIELVMDRYWMTMTLAGAGLPIPNTSSFESERAMLEAVRETPSAVIKPVYTSKGRGMVRVGEDGDRFLADAWQDSDGRVLLQEFVQSPGRDIGACVLGGRFVGAFYRVAEEGRWMTTTAAGGRYQPCDLSPEGITLAERVAGLFGLDYTIVDLVESKDGLLIYEASAFGGFRGLWDASRHDVARDYARHILQIQSAPQAVS